MSPKDDWKRDPEKKRKLIEKMAKLLQEGHRMLDEVCPQCDAILFLRKDVGLRYCPNCDIFLASPEELSKLDKKDIVVVGEYSGGKVVEYKGEEQRIGVIKPQRTGVSTLYTIDVDVSELLNRLIKEIVNKILTNLDYELSRLSLKESFELLKLICEIKSILSGGR